ncbi:MAG: hypothetical protein LUQ50_11145, partial [Methanospirillum sp.]|uniref:hypothetical protein n=1 Tax=Methanospirillum sp. TaxID=45200 RepID=UPI002370FA3B
MGRRKKITEVDGFLRIPVTLDRLIFEEEKNLIISLNTSLSPKDIRFAIEEDLICVYLASLDPDS